MWERWEGGGRGGCVAELRRECWIGGFAFEERKGAGCFAWHMSVVGWLCWCGIFGCIRVGSYRYNSR